MEGVIHRHSPSFFLAPERVRGDKASKISMPSGVVEIIAFLPRKVAAGPTTKPPRETGHLHLHPDPASPGSQAGRWAARHALGQWGSPGGSRLQRCPPGEKRTIGACRDAPLFVAIFRQNLHDAQIVHNCFRFRLFMEISSILPIMAYQV